MSAPTRGKNRSSTSLSEKLTSYYDNVKSRLLGNDLTGRRQTCEENPFTTETETQLTGFKKETQELHLKVQRLDLARNINRKNHRTEEFEVPNLIIRRGQIFELTIEFARDFNKDKDGFTFKFVTGSRPSQSRGSVIPVSQISKLKDGEWGYEIVNIENKKVSLRMSSSSASIVGRYELFVDTVHRADTGSEKSRYKHPDDIYVLFNPWQPDDSVYLEVDTERQDYVLNETGRIWLGSLEKHLVRPWNFGQFEYVSLIAAISLLDRSDLADQARSNPALVTRAVCHAVHHTERKEGLIQACWSGDYVEGTAPYAWTGSPAILEDFLRKRKGVKYGQCWTLSAVATTLLRSLGIPSRCVTSYRAVHDSDFTGPVNTHWSLDLTPKTNLNDSIWSFHVWNEAWFTRRDIPGDYNGWQVFDPTPMDCSEGVFTCGPTPVKAVLNGDLHLGNETKYLFAELHGGRVHWQVDEDGNMEPFMGGRPVGRAMSTKSVGTISRQDVTSSYKYSDEPKEKEIVCKVEKLCKRKHPDVVLPTKSDVIFNLSGTTEKSGDFHTQLKVKNTSNECREVDVYLGVFATSYTGVTSVELKRKVISVKLEPLNENSISIDLCCSDYINVKDTDNEVTAYVMAKVRQTGQKLATVESFCFDRPVLELKTQGRAVEGHDFQVVVKLTNTLSVPLTDGVISVDGPGITRACGIKLRKQVEPGEDIRETVTLNSRRSGVKEIVAVFYCNQVCNVACVAGVDIVKE